MRDGDRAVLEAALQKLKIIVAVVPAGRTRRALAAAEEGEGRPDIAPAAK